MERKFLPVSIALLTVSDTRVLENDKSGNLLADRIEGSGHVLFDRKIVKDDVFDIQKTSKQWIKCSDVEVIISTGGTGLTGRDVSPEAFYRVKVTGGDRQIIVKESKSPTLGSDGVVSY